MTWRLESGWDLDRIGSISIDVEEDDGSNPRTTFTTTLTTGRFCHTDVSGTGQIASGDYTAFATKLASQLSSDSTRGFSYKVTWDGGKQQYTIDAGSGNTIALKFDGLGDDYTRMRRILGFSGDTSHTQAPSSDVTPYYVLVSTQGGASNFEDDFEPDDRIEVSEAEDGTHYSQIPTALPTYAMWEIWMESRQKTFERAAPNGTTAGDVPWTFQHFIRHARTIEPFVVLDDRETTVHFLRGQGAHFTQQRRSRITANIDKHWKWRINAYVEGRLNFILDESGSKILDESGNAVLEG